MKNLILVIFSLISLNLFSQSSKGKIGIIFNSEGPVRIYRDVIENIPQVLNAEPKYKYYGVLQFLGTEKGSPVQRLKEKYFSLLKEKGYEVIEINENINETNFSKFTEKQKKVKFFQYDIRTLKQKYGLDRILIVNLRYGLEVEQVGIIEGDKRTNINLSNYFVNTDSNAIEKEFFVYNIKNIKKKDLNNPPDFPNVTESMDRLLNERIFPDLKLKLESF